MRAARSTEYKVQVFGLGMEVSFPFESDYAVVVCTCIADAADQIRRTISTSCPSRPRCSGGAGRPHEETTVLSFVLGRTSAATLESSGSGY